MFDKRNHYTLLPLLLRPCSTTLGFGVLGIFVLLAFPQIWLDNILPTPKTAQEYLDRAVMLVNNKPDRAMLYLDRAISLDPKWPPAYVGRAYIFFSRANPQKKETANYRRFQQNLEKAKDLYRQQGNKSELERLQITLNQVNRGWNYRDVCFPRPVDEFAENRVACFGR